MELKDYQVDAINNLEDFLRRLNNGRPIDKAFREFWNARDMEPIPGYRNNINGVPQVCLKVPTGGGKTFMAAASIRTIFNKYPAHKTKVVVWLVPSEAILTQTYQNLNNIRHPYHQRLSRDFNGQIRIYNKTQLLNGENFNPNIVANQLSVMVLSYDSLRTKSNESRKVYQQNGNMLPFIEHFNRVGIKPKILKDTDEISLIQVIRGYNPVIIVDESHHATTDLSIDMLNNINPSFILELTATPKTTSNIIAYVPPSKLKANDMVKLPVIVYNRNTLKGLITDAIDFRNNLEKIAADEKIRPIVLFQAESNTSENSKTFKKIKDYLIAEHNINAEHIAIKTATINELKGVNLMAEGCQIRYIITVNALKEGWDCPFAYILASLANRTSVIDVEQILGRILRRPFTKKYSKDLLNMSYVYTSSANFYNALNKIVEGLNAAGYSENEYRADPPKDDTPEEKLSEPAQEDLFIETKKPSPISQETISPPVDEEISATVAENLSPDMPKDSVKKMITTAVQGNRDYEEKNKVDSNTKSPEEIQQMNGFNIRSEFIEDAKNTRLPKLFLSTEYKTGLFGDIYGEEITLNMFRKGFELDKQDIKIDFSNLKREIALIDVHENKNENIVQFKSLSELEIKYLREQFDKIEDAKKVGHCSDVIANIIDMKKDIISTKKIRAYVKNILSKFDMETLRDASSYPNAYAQKIEDKINSLLDDFAYENFKMQAKIGKIFALPIYEMPEKINPIKYSKNWANSLYIAEEEGNSLENNFALRLTSLENILWWHRNRSRKGFCINGYINHYPDFIIKTKSGKIIIVETKGDDRDNSDSERKAELGKLWENQANISAAAGKDIYKYFMVFESNPTKDALTLDDFISAIKSL